MRPLDTGVLPSTASSTAHARHWLWNLSNPLFLTGRGQAHAKCANRDAGKNHQAARKHADSPTARSEVRGLVGAIACCSQHHDTTPQLSPHDRRPIWPKRPRQPHSTSVFITVRTAHPKRHWNRGDEVWGGRNGIHQTKLEGPVTTAKKRGPWRSNGARWSSTGAARHQHWSGQGSSRKFCVSEIADQDQPHHALRHGPACNKRRCMTDGASNALWCAAVAAAPLAACGCGYGARSLGFAGLSQFSQ